REIVEVGQGVRFRAFPAVFLRKANLVAPQRGIRQEVGVVRGKQQLGFTGIDFRV
nr:hypothetical protein [Tanacetum cinerariifolium]